MRFHMCTTRVCQFLCVSLMFVRFALICAQRTGQLNAGYVSSMRSYPDFVPPYNKYAQKQAMSVYEDENKSEGSKSNNRRQRVQQQQPQRQQQTDPEDDEDEFEDVDIENVASYDQNNQYQQLQHTVKQRSNTRGRSTEHNIHKCRIWVPIEAVDKYQGAQDLKMKDLNRQLTEIEVCCKGFVPLRWMGKTKCLAYCESCRNRVCKAPNECECYEGFIKNDNGDCVFTCPLDCLNGRCYLDGTCQCDPGYKLDETRKFCRPICSAGCNVLAGQNCTEPEVCGCAKGFQLKTHGCERVCDPDCGIHGKCNEDNICECSEGYTLKDDVCQSDCYQECADGVCVSRNRCICNPNYRYHERSTMCIPT